jgi:mRNA interferase MazF
LEQSIVRGGIYLVQLGEGVGSEQSGSRPFLVLQNDKGNEHSFTYTGVTLSTELKSLYLPTHIVAADSNCLEYTSVVLVEQMRSLSRKRFVSYLGKLDTNTLNEVEVAVSIQLGLKNVRDTDKVTFMKRLTKINPFLNVFLCGKCRRVLYKVKGLSIYGIHESTEALDFCALCHTAKGRKYNIVNRERLKRNEKVTQRAKKQAHVCK